MGNRVNSIIIIMVISCWSSVYAGIWVEPESFDITLPEGCTLVDTLTIGNSGPGDLNFTLRSRETSREMPGGLSPGGTAAAAVQAVEGNKIVLEYEFSEPVISKGAEYDSVRMEGLESYERIGAPVIPVRPVRVLVPFGKEVISARVISSDERELAESYRLPPAQRPYPLSYKGKVEKTLPDAAIYGLTKPWPGLRHEAVGTQSKRGYKVFTANLFPLQYTPATGKITYTKKMQLEIRLANSVQADAVRPSKETRAALRKIVDNPKSLETYPAEDKSVRKVEGTATLAGGGPYQYVIITNQSLASAPGPWNFQALRDNKISKGMTATIVTTEWIYANYSGTRPSGGSDNQTRIRNFLIDAYQTWDTQYVLLGGTDSIVPARRLWVQAYPGGDIDSIPSDMYYSCVEPAACTFDYDADGNYGEPTDGVGGGDVDLYADIYVGRAPVENATEVANFVRKTLTYDSSVSDYLPLITMVGEWLGFGGVAEYATDSMEQIRLGGSYDGYFTYGFENHIQPTFYDFDTSTNLYDSPGYSWPNGDLINLMNSGKHVFNHLGHASYTYCMKLYNSDLASLNNTDYFFVYSQGCMPGGFDTTNCFAETITSMEHGAFAAIMNARYGWGMGYSTDGPSQRFDRQYWDAVLGEKMLEMGRANSDSKEDNLWDINGECIRWCYYELNLFGDPQQQFRFEQTCEWLSTEPQQGTVAPGDSCDINVTFNASDLSAGTYEAEIIISSNDPLSPTIIPVTMTVSPDDLGVTPAENFEPNGTKGGPFTPVSKTYTLENIGTTSLNWTVSKTQSWLGAEPNSGSLEAGHSVEVNVSILPNASSLDPNIYTDTLTFRNTNSGNTKKRSVTLTVKPPDYFTESFGSDNNDLEFLSLAFSPNGSIAYYEACREKTRGFLTDPNGGTYVALGDDDFAEVILSGGKKVLFYGQLYERFYIGSNGYITFGQGDTEFSGTLSDHFSLPRISGLFTDLAPASSQNISYKQLDDRFVVTFKDVPPYGNKTAKNSFQIEMFFADGTIRVTWLSLAATSGVAGLSEGHGLPPVFFAESDLNKYSPCWPSGDFSRNYSVDFIDFAVLAMHWLDEGCGIPYWCGKSDLDFSSTVDTNDMGIFADNWLTTDYWWLEPISHWKLDEGSGTIAYDSAGTNNGTVYGAVWTTGQIGGALSFDGSNDYVNVGDLDVIVGSNPFTIAGWVNPNLISGSNREILNKASGTNTYQDQILVRLTSGGKLEGMFSDGSVSGNTITGASTILLSTWSFLVFSWDGTTNPAGMKLYVNGTLDATRQSTCSSIQNLNYPAFIGAHSNAGSPLNYFNGKIDDVRIYDRALSAQEIFELCQTGHKGRAFNPNPSDGAVRVDPNVVLGWSPGYQAVSHDVYFGTNYSDVNDGVGDTYKGNYDANSYDPNGLALGTTYYWRIDEVGPGGTTAGPVWSFTTTADLNLVSWWKFDETSGTTAYDSAGTNNGTVYGAAWTTGKIGGALSFDGVNDYVRVGDKDSLELQTLTLSFWGRLNNPSGTMQGGIGKGWIFGDPTMFSYRLEFSQGNAGATISNTSDTAFGCVAPIGDTNWHMWSMTIGSSKVSFYKDGILQADSAYTGTIDYTKRYNNFVIGARDGGAYYSFNGKIDDVRFYNRALSAEEVQQLYQSGSL